MNYLPPPGYRRVLVLAAYFLLGALGAYIFFTLLLKPLLPFLLAWLLAMLIQPTIRAIAARTHLNRKLVAFFCVLFVLLLLFGLVTVLFGQMAGELKGLSSHIIEDTADAVGDLFSSLSALSRHLPFLEEMENREAAEAIQKSLSSMIEGTVIRLSERLPQIVMNIASSLPDYIFFTVVLIVAAFHFGMSVGPMHSFIVGKLSPDSRKRLFSIKEGFLSSAVNYLRAYLMLLIITFVQLLIGFLCLKIPYALTLAALIALIDLLPILGVGTVLLPWAAVLLIRGEMRLGVGLLLVFFVIWLVRQIIEPKIVGHSIGLPPLITLMAMYFGYHLLSVAGMFLIPVTVMLIKNLYDSVRRQKT